MRIGAPLPAILNTSKIVAPSLHSVPTITLMPIDLSVVLNTGEIIVKKEYQNSIQIERSHGNECSTKDSHAQSCGSFVTGCISSVCSERIVEDNISKNYFNKD